MKEKLKEFKNKKIAVNCRTQKEYDDFMKLLEENGFKWQSGTKPTQINEWKHYEEKTTITSGFNVDHFEKWAKKNYDKKLTFGDTESENNWGWKVVSYKDFIESKMELIDLLTKIRNGEIKYGDKFLFDNKIEIEYILSHGGPILAYKEDGKWKDMFEEYNLHSLSDKIEPITKELLDKEEKEYLEYVIRPFRNEIEYIKKKSLTESEYIYVVVLNNDALTFPNFKKGTMYKGLKDNVEYTLEELGL